MNQTTFPDTLDILLLDGRLITMAEAGPYGIIDRGALGIKDGRIAWLGPQTDLPPDVEDRSRITHRLNNA